MEILMGVVSGLVDKPSSLLYCRLCSSLFVHAFFLGSPVYEASRDAPYLADILPRFMLILHSSCLNGE